jgi:Lrp/AsnC family transcriptional regulator, leucine-responsive regulatory protein
LPAAGRQGHFQAGKAFQGRKIAENTLLTPKRGLILLVNPGSASNLLREAEMTIDDIDLRILDMLQRNGKLSQAKIAGAVGLTTPSVNERIKKMERHGMIKGFVALLDHEKMGFSLTAYVDVALEHPRFEKSFVDDLEKLLGVQECHYLAGDYAYRLKVKAADTAALADFLQKRLLTIKGVARARTQISLSSKKESTLLPLVIESGEEKK